jgi:hypothetical protein
MIETAPQLKRLVAGFQPRRPGFEPGSGQLGYVVDKVALGQVFPQYFGFPCQSSSRQKFSILTITWGRYNTPISQLVADVSSGPSLNSTPPHYAKLKKNMIKTEVLFLDYEFVIPNYDINSTIFV